MTERTERTERTVALDSVTLHKHHGLGNDFLVLFVDDLPSAAQADSSAGALDWAALAVRVCDRRRGIGADGLLLALDADTPTPRMVLHNADGSRAEMSGNGIRCFAQALARRTGTLADQLVRTDAGERTLTLSATDDPQTVDVRVAMGDVTPIAEPDGWPAIGCHPDRPVSHLSLGNPHTVVGVDDVHDVDLAALGAKIPQVNLEIVQPGPGLAEITMRVHERGAGITEACGTGACASAVAARSWGLVPGSADAVTVHMDGGAVLVEIVGGDADGGGPVAAILTGPATHVGSVTVDVPIERLVAAGQTGST